MSGTTAGYILVVGAIAAVIWTLYRSREQRAEEHWDPSPAHPAARAIRTRTLPQPGRPVDGKPLTPFEERQLGRIEMEALVGVPEPDYRRESAR